MLLTGYFGGYSTEHVRRCTELELAAAARDGRAVAAAATSRSWCTRSSPTARPAGCCARRGIPVHRDVDRACAVLAGAGRRARRPSPTTLPVRRPRRSPTRRTTRRGRCSPTPASPSPLAASVHDAGRARGRRSPSRSWRSRSCSRRSAGCTSPTRGGVVLGLPDAARGARRRTPTWSRASRRRPSRSRRWPTSTRGVELIVGCVRDPTFGPVLMVGLGGVFAEVLGDTALALAPVSARRRADAAAVPARRTAAARRPGPRAGRPRRARRRWSARVSAARGGAPGARRARAQPGAGRRPAGRSPSTRAPYPSRRVSASTSRR